MIYKA